jgi:hypothetical protein
MAGEVRATHCRGPGGIAHDFSQLVAGRFGELRFAIFSCEATF